ncbi:MAG: L-threonylcarbamoyladenylate synthase [Erysipelotrichales bacterium]
MKTEILNDEDIIQINKIVGNDGVIVFATETVYGLGARADSFLAYENIFKSKDRNASKVLTLMLHDKRDIDSYALIDNKISKVINAFMPGELTLVLPVKKNTNLYGVKSTIGIRIPNKESTLNLLKSINYPMYVTSANISGDSPATSFEQTFETLDGRVNGIIKGDVSYGTPSTVASIIDGEINILREGKISELMIEEVYNNE